jgi:hypothetical protein
MEIRFFALFLTVILSFGYNLRGMHRQDENKCIVLMENGRFMVSTVSLASPLRAAKLVTDTGTATLVGRLWLMAPSNNLQLLLMLTVRKTYFPRKQPPTLIDLDCSNAVLDTRITDRKNCIYSMTMAGKTAGAHWTHYHVGMCRGLSRGDAFPIDVKFSNAKGGWPETLQTTNCTRQR